MLLTTPSRVSVASTFKNMIIAPRRLDSSIAKSTITNSITSNTITTNDPFAEHCKSVMTQQVCYNWFTEADPSAFNAALLGHVVNDGRNFFKSGGKAEHVSNLCEE